MEHGEGTRVVRLCASGCGKVTEPGRKYCWSCINYKRRYGKTGPELVDRGKRYPCHLCNRLKCQLIERHGYRVCYRCLDAYALMVDPAWMARAQAISEELRKRRENAEQNR